VRVECSSPCAAPGSDAGDRLGREASGPLTGSSARFQLLAPGSVTVTVLGLEGPLSTVEDDLSWRRVGGTAACGGPAEATITVPAP
jgi:hypothetical protein